MRKAVCCHMFVHTLTIIQYSLAWLPLYENTYNPYIWYSGFSSLSPNDVIATAIFSAHCRSQRLLADIFFLFVILTCVFLNPCLIRSLARLCFQENKEVLFLWKNRMCFHHFPNFKWTVVLQKPKTKPNQPKTYILKHFTSVETKQKTLPRKCLRLSSLPLCNNLVTSAGLLSCQN